MKLLQAAVQVRLLHFLMVLRVKPGWVFEVVEKKLCHKFWQQDNLLLCFFYNMIKGNVTGPKSSARKYLITCENIESKRVGGNIRKTQSSPTDEQAAIWIYDGLSQAMRVFGHYAWLWDAMRCYDSLWILAVAIVGYERL
ncbi:hypothetical protein DFH08DRAFT_814977 [Mycena albidolilacea]|uniref:Uncharacterized protein n=1 Tax=Mycena albidolilacea TaxID=1033008 RepID=A0AAD7EKV1_9AGAR|nr:hypothetical protein DFH08DRAFT_814977 [Mycena albidolilacea]